MDFYEDIYELVFFIFIILSFFIAIMDYFEMLPWPVIDKVGKFVFIRNNKYRRLNIVSQPENVLFNVHGYISFRYKCLPRYIQGLAALSAFAAG